MIKKLEMAGLGYHVDANKTTDRLGKTILITIHVIYQRIPIYIFPPGPVYPYIPEIGFRSLITQNSDQVKNSLAIFYCSWVKWPFINIIVAEFCVTVF